MSEQTFEQAVVESRIFYRRELAARLARAMILKAGGFEPYRVASDADTLMTALARMEDEDLNAVREGVPHV